MRTVDNFVDGFRSVDLIVWKGFSSKLCKRELEAGDAGLGAITIYGEQIECNRHSMRTSPATANWFEWTERKCRHFKLAIRSEFKVVEGLPCIELLTMNTPWGKIRIASAIFSNFNAYTWAINTLSDFYSFVCVCNSRWYTYVDISSLLMRKAKQISQNWNYGV